MIGWSGGFLMKLCEEWVFIINGVDLSCNVFLRTVSFSVIVNGQPSCIFKPSRGNC
jgi:hypothetical protein